MKQSGSIGTAMLFFTLSMLSPQILAQDQNIQQENIIKKAWEAMYRNLRMDGLHTIYYETYFHGRQIPGKIYVKLPNQFRNESEDLTLIFDGERAAIIRNSMSGDGEAREIEIVDTAYLSHFEVDIALAFPAFFMYPSQFMGRARMENLDCWELYVELPRGGSVSYYLDTTTHLVVRRLVSWDGDPEQELWENIISGYHDYDGILFESGFSYKGPEGQEHGYYKNPRFNLRFDEQLFRIPEE